MTDLHAAAILTDRTKARAMIEAAERAAADLRQNDPTPYIRRSPMEHERDEPDTAVDPVQYPARESPPRSLRHTHYDYPTGNVTPPPSRA